MLVIVVSASLWAADIRKEFRYTTPPGTTVRVSNSSGSIEVHPVAGRQVLVIATIHSDKVQVNSSQSGNRINAETEFVHQADPKSQVDPKSKEGQVEYQVSVPSDCAVVIQNGNGVIKLSGVHSDVTLNADTGPIELSNISNGHLHVQSVDAPVTLTNVRSDHVEVASNGGTVRLTNVTGHTVKVSSDTGEINYDGDFAGGGDYSLVNGSGNINVNLPSTASVDLAARSINGTVENDFPLQAKAPSIPRGATASSYVSGTSRVNNSDNLSSVQLNSLSGKIRVRKH
jgi:DUF4097 and DUF4098 domain-containing protein YvlB